jgi:pyrophosphatase PpaX
MQITALIFDMDGTIGDTIPMILVALRETFAHFTGRIYTDAEIGAMFGPSEEGVIGRRVPPDVYEPAMQYFLDRYDALHADQPFPGIRELMAYLKERGMRIAVATGKGPRTAAISMRAYGLDSYIDALETGSKHGGNKPELIGRVLAAWGLPAAHVAYIGDTRSDMADARTAGVLPLGAVWSASATVTEADTPYRFASVKELETWLESSRI